MPERALEQRIRAPTEAGDGPVSQAVSCISNLPPFSLSENDGVDLTSRLPPHAGMFRIKVAPPGILQIIQPLMES